MIQRVQRKREGKDQPEGQRSVRELPTCGFHRDKNIASGCACKGISDDPAIGPGMILGPLEVRLRVADYRELAGGPE